MISTRFLTLSGAWEVALVEYKLNYFPYLSEPGTCIRYIRKDKLTGTYVFQMSKGALSVLGIVKGDNKFFADSFVKFLVEENNLLIESLSTRLTYTFDDETDASNLGFTSLKSYRPNMVVMSDRRLNRKSEFTATINIHFSDAADITLHKNVSSYYLYRTPQELKEHFTIEYFNIMSNVEISNKLLFSFDLAMTLTKVEFERNLADALGFKEKIFLPNNNYNGVKKVKLMSPLEEISIYSSIVNDTIIGDKRLPLLGTVWVDTRKPREDIIHEKILNPIYIPISPYFINNISIHICSESGKFVNFEEGSSTVLTLHFKKKE